MKQLICLLSFFILSNFTFAPKKNPERWGVLLYHFLADNTLYFTEDTSFLHPERLLHKKIKLSQLIKLSDEYYPDYSDSLTNNFSNFKEFRYYRDSPDSLNLRVAYYAMVKIKCLYFERTSTENNKFRIYINDKRCEFITYNRTELSNLKFTEQK